MQISFKIDDKSYRRALRMYDTKLVKQSLNSSLRKVTNQSKTEGSKAIREKFNIKARDVNRKLKIYHFHRTDSPRSEIAITSRSIGLLNFGATAVRGRSKITKRKGELQRTTLKRAGKRQGVSATIVKGQRVNLPNAFIARGQRGRSDLDASNAQVFERSGSKGIRAVRVISPTSMFAQERVQDRIGKLLDRKWTELFDHELAWRLRKQR